MYHFRREGDLSINMKKLFANILILILVTTGLNQAIAGDVSIVNSINASTDSGNNQSALGDNKSKIDIYVKEIVDGQTVNLIEISTSSDFRGKELEINDAFDGEGYRTKTYIRMGIDNNYFTTSSAPADNLIDGNNMNDDYETGTAGRIYVSSSKSVVAEDQVKIKIVQFVQKAWSWIRSLFIKE